jgi:hypothetical protein
VQDDLSRLPVPSDYEPFDVVWAAFAKAHPMLGLTQARWAGIHVRRIHGDSLLPAGAIVRTSRGRVLAHRVTFPRMMFSLLIGGPSDSPFEEFNRSDMVST